MASLKKPMTMEHIWVEHVSNIFSDAAIYLSFQDKNWISCRKIEVSLEGKKQYSVAQYAIIESEYDSFKKRYTLKEKVCPSSEVYKFIYFYYYVLLIT